jgi:hypothetical protein
LGLTIEVFSSFALATERAMQAAELAEQHGWTDEPAVGLASAIAARVLIWQGQLVGQNPGSSAPNAPSGRKPSRQ